MDTCNLCHKPIHVADSCADYIFEIDGRTYAPIPYEPKHVTRFNPDKKNRRCPECHTRPGGLHHVGCHLEVCPKCGGYWLRCRCTGFKKIPGKKEQTEEVAAVIPFPASPAS